MTMMTWVLSPIPKMEKKVTVLLGQNPKKVMTWVLVLSQIPKMEKVVTTWVLVLNLNPNRTKRKVAVVAVAAVAVVGVVTVEAMTMMTWVLSPILKMKKVTVLLGQNPKKEMTWVLVLSQIPKMEKR